MRTDNLTEVGKHAFELAGLGKAPFRFVGENKNLITYPDGSTQPGGSCDYCGTGICYECIIKSSDGKLSKVGCDCIRKVGDAGVLRAYRTSPEFRARAKAKRDEKDTSVSLELTALVEAQKTKLAAMAHPYGYSDRQTGKPLTFLDWATWMRDRCGAAGRANLLKNLKKAIG